MWILLVSNEGARLVLDGLRFAHDVYVAREARIERERAAREVERVAALERDLAALRARLEEVEILRGGLHG